VRMIEMAKDFIPFDFRFGSKPGPCGLT
jgi:hypothetical protein